MFADAREALFSNGSVMACLIAQSLLTQKAQARTFENFRTIRFPACTAGKSMAIGPSFRATPRFARQMLL